LEYQADLTGYYRKLRNLPGFALLESSDKSLGSYDILSAYPYEKIILHKDAQDLANIFTKIQQKLPESETNLDLPFQGGAIGFFSYDLASQLANIPIRPLSDLEQVPLVEMGLYDWAIIADHRKKTLVLFSANTRSETALITKEIKQLLHSDDSKSRYSLETPFTPYISKSDYQKAFYAIHADLKAGRCYQVNLTQPFHAEYKGDTWEIYEKLKKNNPTPYSAFLKTEVVDVLSFSPERFITYNQGQIKTSPIKGTARRVDDFLEDEKIRISLQQCEKNRAENIMIVDLMRNDFGKIAKPGSVYTQQLCALESYRGLHHLVSHIEATCKNTVTPLEVLANCFPGGSITGAPKLEAMRVIAEQEAFARGIYCGSIGYFSSHGRFDCNIAIRTMTACNNNLYFSAGGGIVIDSNCEQEYSECFTKLNSVLRFI
jgi:para-aminobenzoate synthetase component 1